MKFATTQSIVVASALSFLVFGACSAGTLDQEEGLDADVGLEQDGLRKGVPGAVPGHHDYCDDPLNPCTAGEGDCDSHAGCDVGLVCGRNKGLQFGISGDACVPAHCINKRLDADETQIDCGGSCGATCQPPSCIPGVCNSDCKCAAGEGDCDTSVDCVAPLVCGRKRGPQYGVVGDACVPAHCINNRMDGDETQRDCGGSCGSICPSVGPSGGPAVFVTSLMYDGNLGGLSGADAKCQARATAGGLSGTYKAFLSDTTIDAITRMTPRSGAYLLSTGTVVAANAADFFSGTHLAPIDRDESGVLTAGEVWTGSFGDGTADGDSACNDWTSTSGTTSVGFATSSDDTWAMVYSQFCNRGNVRLYCVPQ